jgi:hypothetical protein
MRAGAITYIVTTPGYPTPTQRAPWGEPLSIPQFPHDIPLTSIEIELTAFANILSSGFNPADTPVEFRQTAAPAVNLWVPEGPTYGISVWFWYSETFVAPPGPFTYTGEIRTDTRTIDVPILALLPPELHPFRGSGTVPLVWIGSSEGGPEGILPGPFLAGPPDLPGAMIHGSGPPGLRPELPEVYTAAQVRVTYTYIPEPGTALLLAGGLLLVTGRFLRRWKSTGPQEQNR